MIPGILLQHFDKIVHGSDGVALTRRLILNLAVTGRLVQQDSADTPIGDLLAERALPSGAPAPTGWCWTSLGRLGQVCGGATPSKSVDEFWTGTVPWVTPKDMKVDRIQDSADHISDAAIKNSAVKLIPSGSLLMVVRGMILAHSFPVALTTVPVTVNQDMKAVTPFEARLQDMLLLIAKAARDTVLGLVERSTHGTGRLATAALFDLPILLPPLEEQARITAKVDQLMALCNELEATQIERETRRDRLRTTSLRNIVAPDDSKESARFFLRHSSRMITKPDHVAVARQAVRDLAVRGRLVPQDPNDEPANEWLRKLDGPGVGAALADSRASLDGITARYSVPTGWVWALCSQVFRVSGGLQSLPKRVPRDNAWPYLGVSNVQRGLLDLRSVARFELFAGELERLRLEPGDLLVVEGNGSPTEIGRCARWNGEIPDCVHQNHIIRCRPLRPGLDHFALLYLNSPSGTATMRELAITSAGLYSLSVGKIRNIAVPLPPFAEQRRIVAKVDALMAICDELERSLASEMTARGRLLESLLHDALAETGALAAV